MKNSFIRFLMVFTSVIILTVSMTTIANANIYIGSKDFKWFNTYMSADKVRVVDIRFNGDYLDTYFKPLLNSAVSRWNDNSDKRVGLFEKPYNEAKLQLATMIKRPTWVNKDTYAFANISDIDGKWFTNIDTGVADETRLKQVIYKSAVYTMPKSTLPILLQETRIKLLAHEIGHTIGFDHPKGLDTKKESIMHGDVNIMFKTPTTYDRTDLKTKYPNTKNW